MTSTGGASLAIILGASEWPEYPAFETLPAFQNSANFFRDYLLREDGLGLSTEDLLWLFDDDSQPAIIDKKIKLFLRSKSNERIKNIFFFYVGHGGYAENNNYFIALRCTNRENRDLTSLPVRNIARTLFQETPDKRHIVIIDACYASGAVRDFVLQDAASAVSAVREQVRESLQEEDIERGSALFCAAGPKIKAKAPWEAEYTMFSGALHRVLHAGDPALDEYLSLEQIAGLVEKDILNTFRTEAVRPELHTPKQDKGDIRVLRLFPNPARRKELEGRSASRLRADLDKVSEAVARLTQGFEGLKELVAANSTLLEEKSGQLERVFSERLDIIKLGIENRVTSEADKHTPSYFLVPSSRPEYLKELAQIERVWSKLVGSALMEQVLQANRQAHFARKLIVGALSFQLALFVLGIFQNFEHSNFLPEYRVLMMASLAVGISLVMTLVVTSILAFEGPYGRFYYSEVDSPETIQLEVEDLVPYLKETKRRVLRISRDASWEN